MRSVKFVRFSSRSIMNPEALDSDLSLDLNKTHYLSNERVTRTVHKSPPGSLLVCIKLGLVQLFLFIRSLPNLQK